MKPTERGGSNKNENPCIYVTGIRGATEDDLYDAFEKFGGILKFTYKKGYAFIEYVDYHSA